MASLFAFDLFGRDRGGFRLEGRAPGQGRNRVLVLGGGIAGLVTAYELRKLGYAVRVVEARSRVGGRCWTLRGGDVETETTGAVQSCGFAPGEYLNAGPMRISHHHTSVLDYCRAFRLPLVPFPNTNEAAFVHRSGQPRRRLREVMADLRGHTSELLAKVARRDALDAPLTAEDRERLIEYLRAEGRLDASLTYPRRGDNSEYIFHRAHVRGYRISPGASADYGEPSVPDELEALLRSGYAVPNLVNHDFHQQETMLTIPGGMDRLAQAFSERLAGVVQLQAEVVEIRRTTDGATQVVVRTGADNPSTEVLEADFCVCTLPPHLLARLPADFSPATREGLKAVQPDPAGKIALQFRRRFWEQDDDIYGGRSLTDLPITQIYYPFEGFGREGPGVLIGGYHFSEQAAAWDALPEERVNRALSQGAEIHPQYREEFENGFSVEWGRVRHSEYAWPVWADEADFKRTQSSLAANDGPFYFAGDWMSVMTGWQAGAIVAAQTAVRNLHLRAAAG